MANILCWFDLAVGDLKRASAFYRSVLACTLEAFENEGMQCAVFPHRDNDVAGCLVEQPGFKPNCSEALLVYFSVQGRLDQAIAAVETHGGKVLSPKHSIGPHGFRAIVLDSEGNRIALHSM